MSESKLLAFMPWLALQESVAIGNVSFIPFSVSDGDAGDIFADFKDDVIRILSGFHNMQGNSITQCTLIYIDNSNPCDPEINIRMLLDAAHLLAFAGITQNEYCVNLGSYINSSCFETVFQKFVMGDEFMALNIRRRDGSHYSMGHKHGEVKFSMPHPCSNVRFDKFDLNLLKSLSHVLQDNTSLTKRVLQSIWLFDEACSDSHTIALEREVFLFASAFEQLLDSEKSYQLTQHIGELLEDYGSVVVEDSNRYRNVILTRDYEDAEKKWHLTRKWIQELYQLRGYYTHGFDNSERTWGWNILEHTLIAAFVFPLAVKLLLAQESKYTLNETDKVHCGAIDKLLDAQDWFTPSDPSRPLCTWQKTISDYRFDRTFE